MALLQTVVRLEVVSCQCCCERHGWQVRDRCGIHAARLLRIIMQVICVNVVFDLSHTYSVGNVSEGCSPKHIVTARKQKMKMETRSVWDYGLASPKTIGRPALYALECQPPASRLNFSRDGAHRYSMLRAGYVQCLEVSKGAEVTNSKRLRGVLLLLLFNCACCFSCLCSCRRVRRCTSS